MMLLQFEIHKDKLYEFDIAVGRLVKWPMLTLYDSRLESSSKPFEFIRQWTTQKEMQQDLASPMYQNLIGAVKVLGNLKDIAIYETTPLDSQLIANHIN
jgi:hypothetical protein